MWRELCGGVLNSFVEVPLYSVNFLFMCGKKRCFEVNKESWLKAFAGEGKRSITMIVGNKSVGKSLLTRLVANSLLGK